jgi:negative regulator of flagellin synthesis FlgM
MLPRILPDKDETVNIDDALNKTAELASAKLQQKRTGDSGGAVKNPAAGASSTASDSVRLSTQYQTLAKSVANSSSFNTEKVASIKAAIASGKFTVDAAKIADGVLATARDLVNSRKTS